MRNEARDDEGRPGRPTGYGNIEQLDLTPRRKSGIGKWPVLVAAAMLLVILVVAAVRLS